MSPVASAFGLHHGRWIILDQYFKPQPVCRWAQPAVEASLQLRSDLGLEADDIAEIEITTFHEAARLGKSLPETTEQAQYSLGFPVAVAWCRGRVTAEEVSEAAMADPALQQMLSRIMIREDDEFNRAFPANRWARVSVTTRNGERHVSLDSEPRGDPENHLSDDEIRAKYYEYANPVLGNARTGEIEAAADGLGSTGGDLGRFLGFLGAD